MKRFKLGLAFVCIGLLIIAGCKIPPLAKNVLQKTYVVCIALDQALEEVRESGTLTKEDDAPNWVGSDSDISKQKGFDDLSFRTMAPGNKKVNRKRNKERKRKKNENN